MKKEANKKTILTCVLAFLLVSSAFFVFINPEVTTVQAQTTIPSDMLKYEWPSVAASSSRSFCSDGPGPETPSIKWKAAIPGSTGCNVAFNGFLFAQGSAGTYALNGATGETVWLFKGVGNIAKIDNTYMVIGNKGVKIATGELVWTGPAGFSNGQGAFAGTGYVPELKMFLDATYGWNLPDPTKPPTLAWNRTSELNVGGGGNVYGEGKLFIGANDYILRALDARTGNSIWAVSTSTIFNYGMSYYNGMVIHGGLDNTMRAWNASTGKEIWNYNPRTWYGGWSLGTAVAYGMVIEHNQDTYVYAINATTGQLVWKVKGPGISYSNLLTIAGGKVYVQMGERQYRDFATGEYGYSEFNCYDAYTGELVWSAPFENGPPSNEQCNAYGNLYLAPTKPGNQQSGVYNYTSTGAEWTLDEIWCIGGKTADWSMFLSDPQHSAEGDGPTKLQLDWIFKTGGPVVSSATCVDGVIYFGSSSADHKIYAVDAKTGIQKWTFETEFAIYSSVAVVNGRVYTGTDDGNVYCLDAATGNKLWKTPAGGITNSVLSGGLGFSQVRSSPVVLNNRVYVGSLDGNLYCLDAISGSVMWKFKGVEPCVIFATPTIYNNSIYLPSTRGGYRVGSGPSVTRGDFYKLDLSGNIIWHIEVPYVLNQTASSGNWFFASPTVAPNLGIVILRNGLRLTHAFNMTDGKAIWTRDGRYNIGTPVQFGGPPLTDAAIYKYGQLYMNDYYGIVCLNARDGSEVWYTYTSREMNTQGFSYSFNRLYVVNEQGFLFVLDATTGEKLSGYDGWGSLQLHSAPVPYDGKLYVGAPDWNMYCFKEAEPAPEQAPTPTAEPLTADIIAQKVLNSLPAYPAVSSASEIAQLIAGSLPSGVSADEVAQKVVANLPSNPTAAQIAQEISNQLSAKPASVPQEYSIATIVITIAVIAALAIGFVNLYLIKKRK